MKPVSLKCLLATGKNQPHPPKLKASTVQLDEVEYVMWIIIN